MHTSLATAAGVPSNSNQPSKVNFVLSLMKLAAQINPTVYGVDIVSHMPDLSRETLLDFLLLAHSKAMMTTAPMASNSASDTHTTTRIISTRLLPSGRALGVGESLDVATVG